MFQVGRFIHIRKGPLDILLMEALVTATTIWQKGYRNVKNGLHWFCLSPRNVHGQFSHSNRRDQSAESLKKTKTNQPSKTPFLSLVLQASELNTYEKKQEFPLFQLFSFEFCDIIISLFLQLPQSLLSQTKPEFPLQKISRFLYCLFFNSRTFFRSLCIRKKQDM